jgi:hypothetical protein
LRIATLGNATGSDHARRTLARWHAPCGMGTGIAARRRGRQGDSSMASSNQGSGRETTIVDNEVYNVIATLHSKLEGLVAYDKYEQDGQANDPIWQELRQQDEQAVRRLMEQLERFAQEGKLRAR